MPKENTHLLFAYETLEAFRGQQIVQEVSPHLRRYLLGAIIPDTFFYSGRKSLEAISEIFHGKGGNPTNATILAVLDAARTPADMAFILGYITHCALDITFHPVIYYLSGNYYHDDPRIKTRAVYLHRYLETCLDRDLGNTIRIHKIIKTVFLKGLVFEEIISRTFMVGIGALRHSLRRQLAFNCLFTSRVAYRIAAAGARRGLFKDTATLGLFYHNADKGSCLPETIEVADLITGEGRTTTVSDLFHDARTLAMTMMAAAYGYGKKTISRDELLRAIPGLSLDTGKLCVSASDIRYTKE